MSAEREMVLCPRCNRWPIPRHSVPEFTPHVCAFLPPIVHNGHAITTPDELRRYMEWRLGEPLFGRDTDKAFRITWREILFHDASAPSSPLQPLPTASAYPNSEGDVIGPPRGSV